jgi:type II secretory pathway component PulF
VILQKRRALALDALALATKRGSSLPDAFRELRLAAANVGERRIYHACVTDMENGSPMSTALNRLISVHKSTSVSAGDMSNH